MTTATQAGTRADLSGDLVVDFTTTMDMPFMDIGNLGNGNGPYGSGYGAVDYDFRMGKFEVTAGQYTEFLNAVGATDTYSLYNDRMSDPVHDDNHPLDLPFGGANIQRSGSPGSYTYSVAADWADRPVNYVSWGDVARFANWMTNGMPTGAQDATTTEDGSYPLLGATSSTDLKTAIAARKTLAQGGLYFMPSEDEWYKAAFHKNDGDTSNYFDYATSSDTLPGYIADGGSITDPDPGNVATFDGDAGVDGIGAPYYRTEAGEHENTASPYGTFDMNGNVGEWTEGLGFGSFAIVRNGEYAYGQTNLHADFRRIRSLTRESGDIGFRLASLVAGPTCAIGDADCDGYVSNLEDIQAAFTNFTGPGTTNWTTPKTRAQGDVHGDGTGATTNPAGHDQDVDNLDIQTMFTNFNPAPDAAGDVLGSSGDGDPAIPDLIYDPATGEVVIDWEGNTLISYVLKNGTNSFIPGNHSTILLGSFPTATSNELSESTSFAEPGVTTRSMGNVFPTGLDLAGLQSLLTVNSIILSLGGPQIPFDLVVTGPPVPEPASFAMLGLGLLGLGFVAYRRER